MLDRKKEADWEQKAREDVFWKTLFIEFFIGAFLAHFFSTHGLSSLILPMFLLLTGFLFASPFIIYPRVEKYYKIWEGKEKGKEAKYAYNVFVYIGLAFVSIFLSNLATMGLFLAGMRNPALGITKLILLALFVAISVVLSIRITQKKFKEIENEE